MSAAKSFATCAAFYLVYKLAGGVLPWWPLWWALGLSAAALYVDRWTRNLKEAR
jgi:hypothetical protein